KSNNAILFSVRQTLSFDIRLIEQVLKISEIKLALSQGFLSFIFIPLNSHASIASVTGSHDNARACFKTFSTLNPRFLSATSPGAEAPKRLRQITSPFGPT